MSNIFYYGSPAYGIINGINKMFTVRTTYVPGTLRVHLNGVMREKEDADGWEELGGKRFKLKVAPVKGDRITCTFEAVFV